MDKLKVLFKIAPARTVFNVAQKHIPRDIAAERVLGIFENTGSHIAQIKYRCFEVESNTSSQRV